MRSPGIKPMGAGKPLTVPTPGSVSRVGPSGAAPSPRLKKNTRDYGKAPAAPTTEGVPSPFGPTEGSSRLGGI
jgi:hypothetical protein